MQKTRLLAAAAPVAALLSLAACNNKPTEIVGGPDDPQAEALKHAPKVAPPPMIQASRTYRCKDNSLVYVDFYTDNSAQVRTKKDGEAVKVTGTDGKPPFAGGGYSVSANATTIDFTAPGKGSQSCKA
ncbi:MAG: hypothetical protein JWO25_1062 [Alphaproteobacteria bacterium]|nr:hypothetical protein [Alphaproteobacteria bacterium]MDB5722493.1 hypothetical protein [Alphaproteobacteria bacterium]